MNFSDTWNQTERQQRTDKPSDPETDPNVPDGDYEAQVLDWRCFRSKAGEWYMKWILGIQGGEQDGKTLVRFVKVDLSDPMRLAYLKSDVFHSLGRDAEFSELADEERGLPGMAKREIDGAVLRVRKRSREAYGKTFLDVFINGTVSLSGGASAPPEVPAGSRPVEYVDGDEIPF